jgi:hypothetical protein
MKRLAHVLTLAWHFWTIGVPLNHTLAAAVAATPALDVELLLGMAQIESARTWDAVSRVERGRRVTGAWPARTPAGRGPWFCGPLQAEAYRWSDCLAMRDGAGYAAGVDELRVWLRTCRGDLTCALNGHGCGNLGAATGRCNHYAERVLWQARRLRELNRGRS